jgi:fumarate hydratase class I
MAEFIYEKPFQLEKDITKYKLLTKEYVRVFEAGGKKVLKVDPRGLELLAKTAVSDISFFLRTTHLEKLAAILDDPEATDNDRFVAYVMIRNSVISSKEDLPWCQDTGTAIVIGKKGEGVVQSC